MVIGAIEALGRDEECHGEVFFAVRSGTRVHHGKFGCGNLPGEVAFVRAVGIVQVAPCKVPKFLEHLGVVGQCRDEHAVTHPFGADVVMADVDDVGHVVGGVKADSLVDGVPFKKLMVGVQDELVCEVGAVASFQKKVAGFKTLLHGLKYIQKWFVKMCV